MLIPYGSLLKYGSEMGISDDCSPNERCVMCYRYSHKECRGIKHNLSYVK